jgi:hypothetical protein
MHKLGRCIQAVHSAQDNVSNAAMSTTSQRDGCGRALSIFPRCIDRSFVKTSINASERNQAVLRKDGKPGKQHRGDAEPASVQGHRERRSQQAAALRDGGQAV